MSPNQKALLLSYEKMCIHFQRYLISIGKPEKAEEYAKKCKDKIDECRRLAVDKKVDYNTKKADEGYGTDTADGEPAEIDVSKIPF